MKIIKRGVSNGWPRKATCSSCRSVILIDGIEDLIDFHDGKGSVFNCPVCGDYQRFRDLDKDEAWAVFSRKPDRQDAAGGA